MTIKKKDLVTGAFSLALSGLISKILGIVYIVPLQNLAKDYTMGLYQMAYSIYLVILMITTAGIPLAISKLIAERNAIGDSAGTDQIYRVSMFYLSTAGFIFFLIMFAMGGVFADLMGDPGSSTAIRTLSFAVLVVPPLAAMRGYVQGHHLMELSGNAQVVEQLVRVIAILVGVYITVAFGYEARITAAVATFGAVVGALASLVFLARHVIRIRRDKMGIRSQPRKESNKQVLLQIASVAIPITLTSLVVPLSQFTDSLTITNLLTSSHHFSYQAATAEYGILTARAFRLIAVPLSLAVAIGLSLMPAISEQLTTGNMEKRNELVITSLRLTSFFSFPTAVILLVFAGPIDIALFQDVQGSHTIAWVSGMTIFASMEIVCAYLLQALGRMYQPIRYMFAGLGLKILLNFLFVPQIGITGAAIASVFGYVLSAILSLSAIVKVTGIRFPWREMIGKPCFASLAMGIALWGWTFVPVNAVLPWSRFLYLILILCGGATGLFVFLFVMIQVKGITVDEVIRIPVMNRLIRKSYRVKNRDCS